MKKMYNRAMFAPDDTSIGGPFQEPEEVPSDIGELFEELAGPEDGGPEDDNNTSGGKDADAEDEPEGGEPAEGDEPDAGEGEDVDAPDVEDDVGDQAGDEPEYAAESEIVELKAQIAELTKLVSNLSKPKDAAPAASPEVEEPKVEVPPMDLNELFKDVDFDKVMETKEGFLSFLSQAISAAQNQTAEKVLSSIPTVVGSFVQRQAALKDVAKEFYSNHPELKRVKRYVSQVANEVSAENPDWTLADILEEAAKRTKETLGIKETILNEDRKKSVRPKRKPTLPGGTRTAKPKSKPTNKLQSEIDSVIED